MPSVVGDTVFYLCLSFFMVKNVESASTDSAPREQRYGNVSEWLGEGLQNLLHRFESDRCLMDLTVNLIGKLVNVSWFEYDTSGKLTNQNHCFTIRKPIHLKRYRELLELSNSV